jgi:hypothetical protein
MVRVEADATPMTKPQIIQSHDPGFHNSDLPKSTLKIVEGSSWKRLSVVVMLPAADMMPSRVAMALWSLAFPPNQAVHKVLTMGTEVGEAYSNAIAEIVDNPQHPCYDWPYLLTVESDNIPPPDGLVKLLKQAEAHPEFMCIGGLYWCKGPEGCPHLWGSPEQDPVVNYRPQPPRAGQLMEVYGTSMGFNVWRLQAFKDKRLRRPWFKTIDGSEGQGIGTQDLYAWSDFRKHGYRGAVDCSVLVGHLDWNGSYGPKGFVW